MNRLKAIIAAFTLMTGVTLTAAPAASAGAAGGAAATRPAASAQAAFAATTAAAPLLMIHGFSDSCYDAFDYPLTSTYNTSHYGGYEKTIDFLTNDGFSNPIQVGYYDSINRPAPGGVPDDGPTYGNQCGFNLNEGTIPGSGPCNNFDANWKDYGTTDDHIERLGCLLAWYIYDNYTLQGTPVNVLAHSMGGLIIRYAIGATNADVGGNFPPGRLLVANVVTVATPHQGLPDTGLPNSYYPAAVGLFGQSNELSEMDASSPFMQTLSGSAYQAPQGLTGTYWTLIGASDGQYGTPAVCDNSSPPAGAIADGGNLISCALGPGDGVVPDYSQMGMQSNAKILYGVQSDTINAGGVPQIVLHVADVSTQYEHEIGMPCGTKFGFTACFYGGPYYLNDNSTDKVMAWECQNCGPGIPGGNPVSGVSRSLTAIANGLQQYNALCVAGRYSDGSTDQAILNAWNANGGVTTLGCPFDNGGGVYVHYWGGPQAFVQDFTGGSFGPAILVDGPQGSYFVNYGFRTAYISGGYNSTCLAPTDNAYGYGGGTRQDFLNCYMTWTPSTGVVVHGPNPTTCTNYGGTTMTGPNACVGFTTANAWYTGHGVGLYGQEIWTHGNGTVASATADYTLYGLSTTRSYQLQAYIPNNYSDASNAHYHFCGAADGCGDGYVNQNNYTNAWAPFGTTCTSNGSITIVLANDGGDPYAAIVGADAIRAVPVGNLC